MGRNVLRWQGWALAFALSVVALLAGCGPKHPPAVVPSAAPSSATAAPTEASVPAAHPLAVTDQTWTPEALEALLAPIALYPDPVLSQVLIAATNPQEVLDAGNWLIANPKLADKALDQAAAKAGFTPPVRALMQFRQIVDQMCLKMGWTAELGQAFTNDQPGVLAAVQRLRRQAQEAGNLQNSPQMKVEMQDQGGQPAIMISPPSPQVVYVPQYDPVTAYAPATTDYSEGALVPVGVLAFGAGLIVGNIFDHDYDDYYYHRCYYPSYGYGRYPSCPPHYYRPVYGNGYRPGHYYNRPPHYENSFNDNNVVPVNSRNDHYWGHFDERPTGVPRANTVPSPITVARPERPELTQLYTSGRVPTPPPGTMSSPPERLPDYQSQPYAGAAGQRPYAGGQGQPPYVGSQHPPTYSGAPGQRPNLGAQGQPPYAGATGQRSYAGSQQQPYASSQSQAPYAGAQPPPPIPGFRQPSHAGGPGQSPYTGARPEATVSAPRPESSMTVVPSAPPAQARPPSWPGAHSNAGASRPPSIAPPPATLSPPPSSAAPSGGNRGAPVPGSTGGGGNASGQPGHEGHPPGVRISPGAAGQKP